MKAEKQKKGNIYNVYHKSGVMYIGSVEVDDKEKWFCNLKNVSLESNDLRELADVMDDIAETNDE